MLRVGDTIRNWPQSGLIGRAWAGMLNFDVIDVQFFDARLLTWRLFVRRNQALLRYLLTFLLYMCIL